jgi:hypothetical protein
MTVRLLLLSALLLVGAAARAETPLELAGFELKLVVCLAKGPANSCGPGCDRWIAVEGKVDQDAADRIRRFLRDVKDTQRPIYFHSPGGSVEPSYVIGRLLRSRKAIARIGRTIVTGCAAGTQIDEACMKIKTAGGEVEGSIQTRGAQCNSACSYLFLGATTREIAPDAAMGVHSSKLTLIVHGHASASQVAEIRERDMAKADRDRAFYIVAMGIDRQLDDLIKTVKFESMHVLTRPELYRFGVDKRNVSETLWTLESDTRPRVQKIAFARKADGSEYRALEWRLFCENKQRPRLMFVREFDPGATATVTVALMTGSEKSLAFGRYPARSGKYKVWSESLTPDMIKAVLDSPRLQMGEGTSSPDGKTNMSIIDIDNSGLQEAWAQLLTQCSPATTPAPSRPVAAWPSGPPVVSAPTGLSSGITAPAVAPPAVTSPDSGAAAGD